MKAIRERSSVLVRLILSALLAASATTADAQQVVDKTVATVSSGSRTELITYSDVVWQLALQPGIPIAPPRSEDLNRALQTLIDQRLFAIEAERLPRAAPTEAEITAEIGRLISFFPSAAAFEARLKQAGFDSVQDPAFERLISKRLAIERYIDFRFRSFVIVSADEETRYYRDVFVPDFRRRYPGLLMPTLDEKRGEIRGTIERQKVGAAIQRFLDEAKRRVAVEILSEV
jgi:hypothetical protein